MSLPTPYFIFKTQGLLCNFTNQTDGQVDSYLWDFGFKNGGTEVTSTDVNPIITFPNTGIFSVTLSATNSTGTNTFTFAVSINVLPSIGATISEMVMGEMIMGIPVSNSYYNTTVKKWQLYLQASQGIADNDVFDETKWPSLVNVLISKLVVWDFMNIIQRSLIGYLQYHSTSPNNSTLIGDYSIVLNYTNPLNIQSLLVGTVALPGPLTPVTSNSDLIAWLNTLNIGLWVIDNDAVTVKSIGNYNNISILTYNIVGNAQATQVLFNRTNLSVSQLNSNNSTSNSFGASLKIVKKIETGPSNAEWYNPAEYIGQLIKAGILTDYKEEICDLALKLNVRLLICPKINKTRVFIVGQKYCNDNINILR